MADTLVVPVQRPHGQPSTSTVLSLALPAEHGGWGLLGEPLLLGLFVAPSGAGAAVVVAAVASFLLRNPARLALADWLRGVRYPRTRVAAAIAAAYAAVAVAAGAAALVLARGPLEMLILAMAPFGGIFLAYDVRLRGRDAVAELAGALALSSGGAAVALAAGWPASLAFGLWLLAAGRALGSVLDVRCRLRRQYGKPSSVWPVFLTQGAFAIAACLAVAAGAVPLAAAAVPFALLARSMWNLRTSAPPVRPQAVGWSEVRVGAIVLLAWVLCYRVAA